MNTEFNVIVSGGGPAGLVAAILLAQGGVSVALVGPQGVGDARTTALMAPAINLLKHIGVWQPGLISVCAPLKQLHIVDDMGRLVRAPSLKFQASELGLNEFGFNVPQEHLIPALWAKARLDCVAIFETRSVSAKDGGGRIDLVTQDGSELHAKLLLIADGADSELRRQLGFAIGIKSIKQMALVTNFDHSGLHENISTEFHKPDGPFTTVPLPGQRSALVWMARPARIEALMVLDDDMLAREIQLESHGFLGRVSNLGNRKAFAMKTQQATPLAKSRAMLIGETAHAMPPIGAQGLNLSLRDAAEAAELAIGASDPGAAEVLAKYNGRRAADVGPRTQFTSLVNHSLLAPDYGLHEARVAALAAVNFVPPLRRIALHNGLYPLNGLPVAMRGPA